MSHFSGNARRGVLLVATIAATAIVSSVGASGADLDESYKDDGGYSSDGSAWKVGGFIGVKPTYEGSDEYEAFGLPYIFPVLSGGSGFFSRIDARGLDDVRFRLYEQDGFIAGPLAGYDLGRDEDDGDLLVGLGDIDGGFVGGGFAGYQLGAILFDVSYHHYFSDADGYQIRFGAETVRYVSDRTKVTARIGATYADDGYMDTYFGTAAFVADSGFKDVHAQLGVETDLDDRWSLRASARYSHLLGDAADSPVVASEDQFYGLLGLSYKFYMAE